MKHLETYLKLLIKKSNKELKDLLKWLKTLSNVNNLLALFSQKMHSEGSWKMQTLRKKSWT